MCSGGPRGSLWRPRVQISHHDVGGWRQRSRGRSPASPTLLLWRTPRDGGQARRLDGHIGRCERQEGGADGGGAAATPGTSETLSERRDWTGGQREPIQLLDRSETSAWPSHCPPIWRECASRGVPIRHVTMLRAANRVSLLLVRTRRDPSGLGQSMPRWWVETFHANQSSAYAAGCRQGRWITAVLQGNHNAVGHFQMPLVDHGEGVRPTGPES